LSLPKSCDDTKGILPIGLCASSAFFSCGLSPTARGTGGGKDRSPRASETVITLAAQQATTAKMLVLAKLLFEVQMAVASFQEPGHKAMFSDVLPYDR
jgi:hypothetical protein